MRILLNWIVCDAIGCYEILMTNKPRKRAPGGGRKPTGPFANKLSTLSTRITQETRDRLEQATARRRAEQGATPWSLSQEIELRLRESLKLPEELRKAEKAWGPEHIKALAQLVSRLVRSVEGTVGADSFAKEASDLSWHRNSYTNAAVARAIAVLLAHYKPADQAQTPPKIKRQTEWIEREAGKEHTELQQTPESVGLSCALGLLSQLSNYTMPSFDRPANEHHAEGYFIFPNIREILGEPKK